MRKQKLKERVQHGNGSARCTTLKVYSAVMIFVLMFNLLLPVGAFAATYLEDKVDVIVTYREEVPEFAPLRLSLYENERSMETLPMVAVTVPVSELEKLQEDPNVLSVSLDQPLYLLTDTRELNADDWNNDMVQAFDAWDDGYTGKNVKVAVLDSGFDEHQDIAYAGGYSVFENESYTYDHDGHGTHVAGIIGATKGTPYQGIAPDVALYGVKVFSEQTGGTTSDLIAGIDWAIQEEMDIINMSLGFSEDVPAVRTAIQEAVAKGVFVVAASGNNGQPDGAGESIEYPAKYQEVIAVAAVNKEMERAEFSATGPENELAAPGRLIGGLAPGNGYVFMSGTSQAAPHVAALAAILMEKYPHFSNQQIRELLIEQSRDLGEDGRDSLYGHGLARYVSEEEEPSTLPNDGDEKEEDQSEPNEDQQDAPSDENDSESGDEASTPPNDDGGETEGDQNDSSEDQQDNPSDEQENKESDDQGATPPSGNEGGNKERKSEVVQVRPENQAGAAAVLDETIASVAGNGILIIFFDTSLDELNRFVLTADQVNEIINRGLNIVIAKSDLELIIPAGVFKEGDAVIQFERVAKNKEIPFLDQAKSSVYTFTFFQNGKNIRSFAEEIEMRFRIDEEEDVTSFKVFYWNESLEQWEEIGGDDQDGFIAAKTNHFSTFGVFASDAFEENEETGTGSTPTGDTTTDDASNLTEDDTFVENNDHQNSEGGTLPNTATTIYHWLAAGGLLLLAGFMLLRKSHASTGEL
ncbi:LPXTG-motif cell wall anchor domain-containing protein [Evansella caseinilytica]|uniref:LPXTG-motif cell wall anchor domain-containing protein n=1 Tax=Evansella caseinilytica TaxID=1503961 RepID=A0A1H3H6N3_9BACI|nr:S8 family peptidase [Evansella caseinilytica]SDY10424.1 LPXTG-motif cell wall anchor domain-containing protein [Evansella caseinilytica]